MDMKNKKKTTILIVVAVVVILLVVIGATFAYFITQNADDTDIPTRVTTNTTDSLTFAIDKDLSITASIDNFASGMDSLSDTSVVTATLKANDNTNNATYYYDVYLDITTNDFGYTTSDNTPELLLSITDPNGNPVTTLGNLTYTTINGVSGFDITTSSGSIAIADEYEISTTSTKIDSWNVTITFVNLDSDQNANTGKGLSAKLITKKNVLGADVVIAISDLPLTYGALANLNCSNSDATYNELYNRIEISSINKRTECTLAYSARSDKQYLNTYVASLVGSTSGDGRVAKESVTETIDNSYITDGDVLTESEYNYSVVNSETGSYNPSWTFDPSIGKFGIVLANDGTWGGFSIDSDVTLNIGETSTYQICLEDDNEYWFDTAQYGSPFVYVEVSGDYYTYSPYDLTTTPTCKYLGELSSGNTILVEFSWAPGQAWIVPDYAAYFYLQKVTYTEDITTNTYNTEIRYEGSNPNNYVWFNNELWRMIGLFDENSHGQSGENLIKIVRNYSIGELAMGNSYWESSNLKSLLNDSYYNASDGTNSGYCYGYKLNPTICDYRDVGIKDKYRNMIKNVNWYLGRNSSVGSNYSYSSDAGKTYLYERRNLSTGEKASSSTSYIGLRYYSDYLYATYNSGNWLGGQGAQWNLTDSGSTYGYATRPVVYLDSSVYIISGTGTKTDPFILGM